MRETEFAKWFDVECEISKSLQLSLSFPSLSILDSSLKLSQDSVSTVSLSQSLRRVHSSRTMLLLSPISILVVLVQTVSANSPDRFRRPSRTARYPSRTATFVTQPYTDTHEFPFALKSSSSFLLSSLSMRAERSSLVTSSSH